MTTKKKQGAEKLMEGERAMGAELARLEAELAELEAPSRPLRWEEIQDGGLEDLDKRERRKAVLPRLISAGKVRHLELRRDRLEAEIGPLSERRDKAEAKLEEARAKRQEAEQREGIAAGEASAAHTELRHAEQEFRQTVRGLRGLGAGG